MAPRPFPSQIAAWNATSQPFATDITLPDLLDQAARQNPSAPALRTSGGVAMTHAQLAEESARQAEQLAAAGIGPGVAVGILADHDFATVSAIIAIVRAGGFYVPLGPQWPIPRSVNVLRSLKVMFLVIGPGFERAAFEIAADVPGMNLVIMTPGNTPAPDTSIDGRMADLWDAIAASPDPCEAAGFNLDRSGLHYELKEVLAYAEHVASLVTRVYRPGHTIVEIGAGSGLIVRELASRVSNVVAIDPAAQAMARMAAAAVANNLPISTITGYAHEAAMHMRAMDDMSVVLLASTVQYFPGVSYLRAVLDDILEALPLEGSIVIADVIDPQSGQFPGSLRIPRGWWDLFVAGRPDVHAEICDRGNTTLKDPLRCRYDVVLTVVADTQTATNAPVLSVERPMGWSELAAGTVIPPRTIDIAYTITTSGSTGVPKAVAMRHRSVVNLIDWFNRRNNIGPGDSVLQASAFTFDLSVYDIFGVLAAGGSVLLIPEGQLAEPGIVVDAMISNRVTLWNSAPAAFTALLPFLRLRPRTGRGSLRRVFLSGDWVPLSTQAELAREFPSATLVVLGGATETCVWSNDYVVSRIDPDWISIPYGRPMQNARYYVLDDDGTPSEVDEPGELYIAGECVAVGYLNDPQLTAQRFLPDPWDEGNSVMYRTGDRARWTRHGWIEFLGRLDQQIKVRGYRIELGEVEQTALRFPGVEEAVALAYGDPRDPRIGLVVRSETRDERILRDHIRTHLPAYMMPTRVLVVTALPISASGKIDRRALLELLTADMTLKRESGLASGPAVRNIKILA